VNVYAISFHKNSIKKESKQIKQFMFVTAATTPATAVVEHV
jgi:hypothetical protein